MRPWFVGVLSLLALPESSAAQFQQVGVQALPPVVASATTVCDTSAFPPFNRHGPWSFALCDDVESVVVTCEISASSLVKDILPPQSLRRALLRLIEEFDGGEMVLETEHRALTLDCEAADTVALAG